MRFRERKPRAGELPNFLIIGAMRSGTTSLARYLGAHPDVFMAPGKELHYFDNRFEEGTPWYVEHFMAVSGEQAIGEATQTYMYDPQAISRIAALVPDCRLIAILRNPVDRAYSHYWHNRARGRETLAFAEAIAAEPRRLASGQPGGRYRYSYVDRGRYLDQLRRICSYFPREVLLVLLFEDLRDSPLQAYQAACGFLNVDSAFIPPMIGQPINRYITLRSSWLRDISRRLPRFPRDAIGRLNSRNGSYPQMDPSTRTELLRVFEADNAGLSEWLACDLERWLH